MLSKSKYGMEAKKEFVLELLKGVNFIQSECDHCLFFNQKKDVWILVYVDDFITVVFPLVVKRERRLSVNDSTSPSILAK